MATGRLRPDHVRMASRSSLFASLFPITAACASHSPAQPQGDHLQYVADHAFLPATNKEAEMFALDLDGDGGADNQAGVGLAALAENFSSASSPGVDFQSAIDRAIAEGRLTILVDIQGLAAPSNAVSVEISTGTAQGVLDPNAPANAALVGSLQDGMFTTDAGSLSVPINFGTAQATQLSLIGARIGSHDANAIGTQSGGVVIGGALLPDDVTAILEPAVIPEVMRVVQRDCCGLPTSPGGSTCNPVGCGCLTNSAGQQLLGAFDTSKDCVVTASEFANSNTAQFGTSPDVKIDGHFALSFGMLVTLKDVTP